MKSWLRYAVAWLVVGCFVGALGHWFAGIDFLVAVGIAGAALFLNSILAEWEDRKPGGFYNPKDEQEK